MKRYFILLLALLVIGCSRQNNKVIVAKINNYEISKEEFEGEFKESAFARFDTLESRKDFLNNLINRKLIMQDAQSKGLDKDKSFLKMIERFWEQSLLKLALDKKSKEIAGAVVIDDRIIKQAYDKMIKDGVTDVPYDQAYNRIKWELMRARQSQIMDNWVTQLRQTANIKVNYGLLEKNK